MENLNNDASFQEDMKASNELLRLQIEREHGIKLTDVTDGTQLSPEVENEWLNHIRDFEIAYANSVRVKVYDLIGKPEFIPIADMARDELHDELIRLFKLLESKGIVLDCCCKYSDEVIYRFIVEELFEYETDSCVLEGMERHFIYEEFHPNHEYDLKRFSINFVERLLSPDWSDRLDFILLDKKIHFQQKIYEREQFQGIIHAFQEAHEKFEVDRIEALSVSYDLAAHNGVVEVDIRCKAFSINKSMQLYQGTGRICFFFDGDYWSISSVSLPGFGTSD